MHASLSDTAPETAARTRLPELFGREAQLFGWQGITLFAPRDWSLAAFSGDYSKGNLRMADEDGVRLELLWERPKQTPNVARSIELLLQNIAREAKRKKQEFESNESVTLLSPARREHADKEQISSFGWVGDKSEAVAHGFGAAWYCPQSERVIVAHVLGRGTQNPDKTRRLAAEVLNSCCSHAVGGWQTWSIFDLQVEIPEEFSLVVAKLQTGRIELDWERVPSSDPLQFLSPSAWGKRPERIGLRRLSAANVVLENETLEAWASRVARYMFKSYSLGAPVAERVLGVEGLRMSGALSDLRRRWRSRLFEWLLRRQRAVPSARAWQNEEANKLFVLLSDLENENAHVTQDVLDSIQTA
jgi:hypothetical protein